MTVRAEASAAMLGASLLWPGQAKAQTVAWFDANPAARASVLAACENDLSRAGTAACLNARASETRAYARRPQRGAPSEPMPEAPFVQRAIRQACARPPSERGMFAPYCTRRL